MADCSRQVDRVKEMVAAGGLSLYGINHYNSDVQRTWRSWSRTPISRS